MQLQLCLKLKSEFVSSNVNDTVTWNTSHTAKSVYHVSRLRTLRPLTKMSEDGTQVLAYSAVILLFYLEWDDSVDNSYYMDPRCPHDRQTCSSVLCRADFALQVDTSSDTDFRAISDNWPVLAFALDLGSITRSSNTLVFGIGLIRDPVVSYRTVQMTEGLSHRSAVSNSF